MLAPGSRPEPRGARGRGRQGRLPPAARGRPPRRASEGLGQAVHGRDQGTCARSIVRQETDDPMPARTAARRPPRGRGRTKSGYLWALARDDRRWGGAVPIRRASSTSTPRAAVPSMPRRAMLAGFTGVLQVDGYSAYKTLAGSAPAPCPVRPGRLASCRGGPAPDRRAVPDRGRDRGPAARAAPRRAAPRRATGARQAPGPGVRGTAWLATTRAKLSPKSRAGEKLACFAHHWQGLQVFLDDGRVEIDTNAVENRIRPPPGTQPQERARCSPVTTRVPATGSGSPR